MNNLFVKMVGTFCSSSYMYLGWVLKNLRSSGALACKSLNFHIIPFILFASLVGCSSSSDSLTTPVRTPNLSLVTLSPSSNTTPSFVVSDVENGALVSLHTDVQCTEASKVESGTATGDSITLTLQTALSIDETYTYFAKQVDRAGNISGCSSAGVDYELDTTAPSAPTIGLAQGISSLSSNTTPSFVVSDVENGALVSLHTDVQCTEASKVESGTATGDSITLTLQTALSIDETYTYFAKQVDRAGNISGCSSAGVDYELDSTAPNAPTIGLAQETSSSSSNTTPSFVVSGVEDGALVSLHTDDQCAEANIELGTATGDSITLTLKTALSIDETYTYYAKQVDRAGNVSPCSNDIGYTLDTIALIPTLSLVTPDPSNNPNPVFSLGNLEIGGSVGLYSDDSCSTLAQDSIGITAESMEITLSVLLVNYNTYSYHTRQTDSFGNVSACSSAISYEFITPPFESVWRVGVEDQSVTLPLRENDGNGNNFDYDFTVYWGDGSKQTVTAFSNDITHEYENPGSYTIKIIGPKFPAWYFNNGGDKNKIIEVKNLGVVGWKNLASAFFGCDKLTEFTSGITDTSSVTITNGAFLNTTSLTSLDVSSFDTSNVTDMGEMFKNASSLTLDLSSFDTSNVENMFAMFANTSSLTSLDLSSFNTSNVTNMRAMFADSLNLESLNLSGWNTSSVINMSLMFYRTSNLTELDLSDWSTSSVINMSLMFYSALRLESLDLSHFVTSSVTDMSSMFTYTQSLESLNLSGWDVRAVTNYSNIFDNTHANFAITCSDGVPTLLGKACVSN